MRKNSTKTIIIKNHYGETLHEFENAYIDSLTDDQLVISWSENSVMYKTIIHLDSDPVGCIQIQED